MKKQQHDILIVGAGPAGLMAAGQAANNGAKVLVLEKMPKPARKLFITGKGRCNLTNTAEILEFINHFGKNGRFLRQAFSTFFNYDLMDFFKNLGVEIALERGGRVFPKSGKALEIVDALVKWVKISGAIVKTNQTVTKLNLQDKKIVSVENALKEIYTAKTFIVTTGGLSYPLTGSSGDGYEWAKKVGHNINQLRPALVPLESNEIPKNQFTDLNLRNIKATVFIQNKKQTTEFGELVFTETGISGPIILTLSGLIVDALNDKKEVFISLDLKPALDEQKLDKRILRDIDKNRNNNFRTLLNGFLPMKLIPMCMKQTGIPPHKKVNQISGKERITFRNWLKNYKINITGYRPIDEAIITAGGIDLKEIDPKTMVSKLVENLYFAGEILDLHGNTGGFNLQAAFSTGYVAGLAAAKQPLA